MKITVKLFATLRNGRFRIESREYEDNTKIRHVAQELNIKEDDLAIILLNGKDADLDSNLMDEAVLCFFPPVGGG